jgi:hypothetical protein
MIHLLLLSSVQIKKKPCLFLFLSELPSSFFNSIVSLTLLDSNFNAVFLVIFSSKSAAKLMF